MTGRRRTAAEAAALLASLGGGRSVDAPDAARDDAIDATIYFDGNSVEVASDYFELVRQCADRFNATPGGMLIVSGHSTGIDEPEHEVELSHHRTRAVARLLEQLGVNSHQIVCVSRGANEPLVDPSDSARRWINRRVEIREGSMTPRPPAWAQQRRHKRNAAQAKAAAGTTAAPGAAKAAPAAVKPATKSRKS